MMRKLLAVIVFTKPACVQCTATYRALDELAIEYEVVDVSSDTSAQDWLVSVDYLQLPVVVVEREGIEDIHWSTFRPDRIKESLSPSIM
jgi:glutaredoxin-like protein NrdH